MADLAVYLAVDSAVDLAVDSAGSASKCGLVMDSVVNSAAIAKSQIKSIAQAISAVDA